MSINGSAVTEAEVPSWDLGVDDEKYISGDALADENDADAASEAAATNAAGFYAKPDGAADERDAGKAVEEDEEAV